jgi:hypothetical protein
MAAMAPDSKQFQNPVPQGGSKVVIFARGSDGNSSFFYFAHRPAGTACLSRGLPSARSEQSDVGFGANMVRSSSYWWLLLHVGALANYPD